MADKLKYNATKIINGYKIDVKVYNRKIHLYRL